MSGKRDRSGTRRQHTMCVLAWCGAALAASVMLAGVSSARASADVVAGQADVLDPESIAHPEAERVRVLPPTVADVVRGIFTRIRDRVQLVKAEIDVDVVRLSVCSTAGASKGCVLIVLSDPTGECAGPVIGPWCVQIDGKDPGGTILAALTETLVLDRQEDIWIVRSAPHVDVPPAVEPVAAGEDAARGEGRAVSGQPATAGSLPAGASPTQGDTWGGRVWWVALLLVGLALFVGVFLRRRRCP